MIRNSSALALLSLFGTLAMGCGEPPPPGGMTWGTGGSNVGTGGAVSSSSGGAAGTGGNVNEPQSSACGSADAPFTIRADESTNMVLTSDLSFVSTTAVGSSASLAFDWSAVDTDLFGHPIDWNEIVMASLVVWGVPPDQIADLINADAPDLMQRVVLPPAQLPLTPDKKQAVVTEFLDAGGSPVPLEDLTGDYLNPANGYTYTLILQDQISAGVGARMIQAFTLVNGDPQTTISVQNSSTTLVASAVFGQPTMVPAATPTLTIDWLETIGTRSFGGGFDPGRITEVIVGQYDPALDLQSNILDLETSNKTFYSAKVLFPEPFDMSTLTNAQGQNFPGIDGTDQWFVGLTCAECSNPSPWFLSKLTPCP